LEIDLGSDINVYDDRQLNQGQRINHVMNDKLLTILRAFAEPVRKLTTIYGLKLDFGIPHKNFSEDSTGPDVLDKRVFLEESEGPDVDKLEVYASAELIRHFAEADITSQQLLDGSVVIVNSNRIQVALSGS
jgi:hypothetical protein